MTLISMTARLGRATLRSSLALALCLQAVCCHAERARELVSAFDAGIDVAVLKARTAALPVETFSASIFAGADGRRIVYRLLVPTAPAPAAGYPLVLVLHGSGAIGDNNRDQLGAFAKAWALPAMMRDFPAYVLVPQFPARSADYAPDAQDGALSSSPAPALRTALALLDDVLAHHAVDRRRVYVTGFSMGASAAWHALLLRPGVFAAAIPIGGIAPPRTTAAQLKNLSLLIVHGNADTENPIASDLSMVAALDRAGAAHVRWREYAGMEHDIPCDMLYARWWREWLFAQRR